MHFVVAPGMNNSDETHWQTLWQLEWRESASRIHVTSWSAPTLVDWSRAIGRAVVGFPDRSVVVVAHGLGSLAAAHHLATTDVTSVAGLFLVAPPDPEHPSFPSAAGTFREVSRSPVNVPGLVVCSDTDRLCDLDVSANLAHSWGLPKLTVEAAGHLGSASDLGRWGLGQALLAAFVAGLTSGDVWSPAPQFETVSRDAPAVRRLVGALTEELGHVVHDASRQASRTAVRRLQRNEVRLLGAFVARELVGVAAFELTGVAGAELEALYVVPRWRRRGVASGLLATLAEQARAAGHTRLRLETHACQMAAIAFFRSHGFRGIPRFAPYVHSETSVCLQLNMAAV